MRKVVYPFDIKAIVANKSESHSVSSFI